MARPSRNATSNIMGGSLATPRMPSVPKSLRITAALDLGRLVTEIHELQLDAEVFGAHQLHARLQIVSVLAGDAHLGFVNRGLHLELLILDELDDLAGGFDF